MDANRRTETDLEQALRPKSIFRAAMPLLAGLLLEQLIGLTDVLFLGRYGEAELAAAGIASIFVMLLVMLGIGYSIGAQSLMSRANGAGDLRRVGEVFRQSALFLVIAGAVVAIVTVVLLEPVFAPAIGSPEVRRAAVDYVFWRTIALPVAYLCLLGRAFFVSILRPRVLTVSSFVMVAVNCALNAVLIFGIGPFPELGIAGAAIASALSEIAALLVLFIRLAMEREWLVRTLSGPWAPVRELQSKLFGLGRWLMLQEAVAFGVWLFFFISVEQITGERGLAISNVVRQLGSLLFLFVHAFGTTCGSLAANLAGAGSPERISGLCWLGLKICAAAMVLPSAVFLLFPEAVLGLLTDLPDVIEDSKPAYYVMTVSYILSIPCYYYYFILGALGFARESFRITILAAFVYALYVGLLAMVGTSVAVFWTSDTVYAVVLGAGAWLVWLRSGRRLRQGALTSAD